MFSTGWYGIAGGASSDSSKVHALANGRPLCGWKPRPAMEYQWCAGGICFPYLECDRCKAKAHIILTAAIAA